MNVEVEFDSKKDAINIAKHGLPLNFAALLFEEKYKENLDERRNYGEIRIKAIGHIEGRLHVCVYTWRHGIRRIISLRKANERETNAYHQDKC